MRAFCCLALLIAGAAVPLAQTFRSRADAVRVDVLVAQNGHPVRGLRASDFELRDEGVLQKIALADVDKIPLSVVLVLDSSASLAGQPMEFLRSAASGLVNALTPPDRAALVSFNHAVAIRSEPSTDRGPILSELLALEAKSTTSLIDGVAAGLAFSDPRGGRGTDRRVQRWSGHVQLARSSGGLQGGRPCRCGCLRRGDRRWPPGLVSAEADVGDRRTSAGDSVGRQAV